MIYLIGSLRNPEIPRIANTLRAAGNEVFDDWYAAGPEADDKWKEYEIGRGRTYQEALDGEAAKNVFAFDKRHLDRATSVVLALPAGKSGHLELGYCLGKGKPGYVLLDNPDRWDVMYQFATEVFSNIDDLIVAITPATAILDKVYRENRELLKNGSNIIFCSVALHIKYESELQQSTRFVDSRAAHSGYKNLAFRDCKIIADANLTGHNVLIGSSWEGMIPIAEE